MSAPWISKASIDFNPAVPFFGLGGLPALASLLSLVVPEIKGKVMYDFLGTEGNVCLSLSN